MIKKNSIIILINLILIGLLTNLFAQQKLSFTLPSNPKQTIEYTGTVRNGKANGYGEAKVYYLENPGGSYKGYWKDNDFHGQGTFDYGHINTSKGDKYVGEWANGKYNGQGTYFFLIGDIYKGEWINGQRTGKGTYFFKNGNKYEGDWQNSYRSGYGKFTYSNGKIEEGKFEKNKFMGAKNTIETTVQEQIESKTNGKLAFGDNLYEGEIQNLRANGKGKMTYKDGRILEGNWLNNLPHGEGKMIDAKGNLIYEGNYALGKLHGKGKIYYNNGDRYEGDFFESKKQGQGIFTFKNNEIYEGAFLNNLFHGKGKMKYISGTVYEGAFENNYENGQGKITSSGGDVYEGIFTKGKCNGQGTVNYKNGDKYNGELISMVVGGVPVRLKGKTIYANGDFFEGMHSIFGPLSGTLVYIKTGN